PLHTHSPTLSRHTFPTRRSSDLEKHHLLVILDTPSAAPPAWLTLKYPDTLRMEKDGRRVTHGNRAQGSVTSARYREFCRRIATEDRKSTRLNSSHRTISYAVFCL